MMAEFLVEPSHLSFLYLPFRNYAAATALIVIVPPIIAMQSKFGACSKASITIVLVPAATAT